MTLLFVYKCKATERTLDRFIPSTAQPRSTCLIFNMSIRLRPEGCDSGWRTPESLQRQSTIYSTCLLYALRGLKIAVAAPFLFFLSIRLSIRVSKGPSLSLVGQKPRARDEGYTEDRTWRDDIDDYLKTGVKRKLLLLAPLPELQHLCRNFRSKKQTSRLRPFPICTFSCFSLVFSSILSGPISYFIYESIRRTRGLHLCNQSIDDIISI